jgi:hypothetical protein
MKEQAKPHGRVHKPPSECSYCGGKQDCGEKSERYHCTRRKGHHGDHIACNGEGHDRHRWPQQEIPHAPLELEGQETETITVEEATLRIKAELDRMEPRDLKEALKIYGEMCYQQGVKYGVQEEHERLFEDLENKVALIEDALDRWATSECDCGSHYNWREWVGEGEIKAWLAKRIER